VHLHAWIILQGEADREWFATGNARDVDHVITTAELGKILVERGIKLNELEESAFDNPVGEGSGGGLLFGTTGGVMEAALRTVYELVSLPVTLFGTLFTSEIGWEWARSRNTTGMHTPASSNGALHWLRSFNCLQCSVLGVTADCCGSWL
jgi:hypothetical protein